MSARLRRDILRVALAMDAAGFAPSKAGNVSARCDEGFLVTPSGLPYAQTKPVDLAHLRLDGAMRSGSRAPSSEWRMHAAIYAARSDIGAIVHTHSPRATALSCARRDLPALHYMIALCGGDRVVCAPYATFGTKELADFAVTALGARAACLLANHGVIACGRDVDAAWMVAREVENLAGLYLDCLAAGLEPKILSAAQMAQARARFADYASAKAELPEARSKKRG